MDCKSDFAKRDDAETDGLRTRTVLIVTPGGLEHGGGIGRQMGYFLRAYQAQPSKDCVTGSSIRVAHGTLALHRCMFRRRYFFCPRDAYTVSRASFVAVCGTFQHHRPRQHHSQDYSCDHRSSAWGCATSCISMTTITRHITAAGARFLKG